MRTKKAFYNIVVSITYQIVTFVCSLIGPRLILSTFGSTYNGVINSIAQFLSMVSILRLGIAGSTRVALYKTLANGDTLGTSRLVKATNRYSRRICIAIGAMAVGLAIFYPMISQNDLSRWETALLVFIVSISTFAEYFFGFTYSTLLQADQREFIYSAIHIVTTILSTVMIVILINLGSSIFLVKFASTLVFALLPVTLSIYCKKKYHLIRDCEPDNSAIKKRGDVVFHSIANIVHNNTDLVILTVFVEAKYISVYTVYYLVVGKIKSIMNAFTSGLEAAFGNMWAKKENDLLAYNFRLFEYAMFTTVAVVFSCVGLLIVPFIRLYTIHVADAAIYIDYAFAILVTLTEAAFCLRTPYLTLVQAAGYYKETKVGAAVEAIVNIVLSLFFVIVMKWGIRGVIVGTLAANLIRTSQYAWFVCRRILHRSLWSVISRFLLLLASSGITVLLSVTFVSPLIDAMGGGWFDWILSGFVNFFLALAVTLGFSVIFYRKDLFGMLKVGKRMLRLRRKKQGANV